MRPMIIGLVGPIRAGKSTVSQFLVQKYGYHAASNSALLQNILERLDIVESRQNLSRLGDALFEVLGNDIFARYRLGNLKHHFPIVVDGIRYLEEIEIYKTCPSFVLVGIISNDNARYERATRKGISVKDGNPDMEKFRSLELARSELDVPNILAMADFLIENDSSIEDLFVKIDSIFDQLIP